VGWSVFTALLLLTPLYLVKIQNVKTTAQVILTTLSFPVWVYTIGGPFKMAGWYHPQIASCLLVVWTLIIPLVILLKNPAHRRFLRLPEAIFRLRRQTCRRHSQSACAALRP